MGTNWRKAKQSAKNLKGFNNEFDGIYVVNEKGGTREVSQIHGRIVNQIAAELKGMGYKISNKPVKGGLRPDIEIIGSPAIIEVKGGMRWADIYCCIGQLYCYARKISPDRLITMIAVVPWKADQTKVQLLRDMGIEVVEWKRKKGRSDFMLYGFESALLRAS